MSDNLYYCSECGNYGGFTDDGTCPYCMSERYSPARATLSDLDTDEYPNGMLTMYNNVEDAQSASQDFDSD